MNTIRKVRRMARDPQPQSEEGAPAHCNEEAGLTAEFVKAPELKPARVTKQSLLIGMLSDEGGATLAAIVEATGWLPHTTRAALTGLRKKGHTIECFRSDDATTYKIVAVPALDSTAGPCPAASAHEGAGSDADAGADVTAEAGCGVIAK